MSGINLPPQAAFVLDTLNAHGYEAVIVGGCVRDALMGNQPKDWDLATAATPDQVKSIFSKTVDTGIRHGTVTVLLPAEGASEDRGIWAAYEITTYRTESGYQDHRRPDAVSYTKSLVEDLRRRDFTMNAIAYHPDRGFIDPFGGMADIRDKIIRGVGCPEERFHEDALRMLRAVRFAGQLGFAIENATWEALLSQGATIVHISAERIREEFGKLLLSDRPEKIALLNESGLMLHYHPFFGGYLRGQAVSSYANLVFCPSQPALRLTLLLEKAGTEKTAGALKDLRWDNKTIERVILLISALGQETGSSPYEIRKQLAHMGREAYEQLLCLRRAQARGAAEETALVEMLENAYRRVLEDDPCVTKKELAVNGNDLIALGFQKGRALGETMDVLFEAVLEKPENNNREHLLGLASRML